MGPTGTGKSTVRVSRAALWIDCRETHSFLSRFNAQFINLVSPSNLDVGDGLRSCTSVVQPGKPFDLDGRRVFFIDTPGFDDTARSDIDVLNMIATFLATS